MNTPILLLRLFQRRRQLRQREQWTRQRLEKYQTRALHALREYAYARSPFYQWFHKGLMKLPLQELPTLTKSLMMEHFDQFVTDPAIRLSDVEAHLINLRGYERFLNRYWTLCTSGSSGIRGVLLFNTDEWITLLSSFARASDWTGVRPTVFYPRKLAVIGSTIPWNLSWRFSTFLHSWWLPTLYLDACEPVEAMIQRLNMWQPEILTGYASIIHALAEKQIAKRLQISPRVVLTGSEVLTDEARKSIKQAWNQQPFNFYGTTESGGIASECTNHQGMHLYEDFVIVEVVDKDNNPVPGGTYGHKVLVTVLFNRTQPLIRYELSDLVRLAPSACSCGRPYLLIEDVQGRTEETLYFPSSTAGLVAVHPEIFHRILEPVYTNGWQVVQEPDGLHVFIKSTRQGFTNESLLNSLQWLLAPQGAIVPPVKIQQVPSIPRGPDGKAVLIKYNLASS